MMRNDNRKKMDFLRKIEISILVTFVRLARHIYGRARAAHFNWYWKKFEKKLIKNAKLNLVKLKYSNSQTDYIKYFDFHKTVRFNLKRALMLELDSARSKYEVIDLGAGFGIFGIMCRYFGHRYTALDCDIPEAVNSKLFRDTFAAINPDCTRIPHCIERFTFLPIKNESFDLIVAFQIVFHRFNRSDPWGADEWTFFLRELRRVSKPKARIVMHFSKPNNSFHYRMPEVEELFLKLGCKIDGPYVQISKEQLSTL